MVAIKSPAMNLVCSPNFRSSIGIEKMSQIPGLGVFWLDRHGNIRHFNQNFVTLLGCKRQDLIDKQIFHFSFKMTYFKLREMWLQLVNNECMEWSDELLFNNNFFKVEVCSWLIESEEEEMICCTIKNNNQTDAEIASNFVDLKMQSSNLSGLDGFAQLVLQSSDEMVFWVNADMTIRYLNNCAKNALGIGDFGKKLNISNIDLHLKYEDWDRIFDEAMYEGSVKIESVIVKKSGENIPVEYLIIKTDCLDELTFCVKARDISDRKNQEETYRIASLNVEGLTNQLASENLYLKEEIDAYSKMDNIVTESVSYRKKVLSKISQVGPTDSTVLILGETGTGKELIAKALHNLSNRSQKAFIKINCAALPRDIIESELFGHEKGAFTGAISTRVGRFELADGGTLFLDEIGEMPLDIQAKLLRVLQEREIVRVGGSKSIPVNVRIIAATNRHLEQMVDEGQFRKDLYYRLSVFPILNMSLKERKEDVLPLVKHFAKKYSLKLSKNVRRILETDRERLMKYDFPGNIRELENIVERAVILSDGEVLNLSDWMPSNFPKKSSSSFQTLFEMQRSHIQAALIQTNWKLNGIQGAAELLGMSLNELQSKLKELNLTKRKEDNN